MQLTGGWQFYQNRTPYFNESSKWPFTKIPQNDSLTQLQKLLWGLQNELLPRKKMTKYHRFLWLVQTFCLSIVCKILGSTSLDTFHAFYWEIVLYLRKCSTQLLKREAALRYLPCLLSRNCTLFKGMLYTVTKKGGWSEGWQDKVAWLGSLFVGGIEHWDRAVLLFIEPCGFACGRLWLHWYWS